MRTWTVLRITLIASLSMAKQASGIDLWSKTVQLYSCMENPADATFCGHKVNTLKAGNLVDCSIAFVNEKRDTILKIGAVGQCPVTIRDFQSGDWEELKKAGSCADCEVRIFIFDSVRGATPAGAANIVGCSGHLVCPLIQNQPAMIALAAKDVGEDVQKQLAVHELGHIAGLCHVKDCNDDDTLCRLNLMVESVGFRLWQCQEGLVAQAPCKKCSQNLTITNATNAGGIAARLWLGATCRVEADDWETAMRNDAEGARKYLTEVITGALSDEGTRERGLKAFEVFGQPRDLVFLLQVRRGLPRNSKMEASIDRILMNIAEKGGH